MDGGTSGENTVASSQRQVTGDMNTKTELTISICKYDVGVLASQLQRHSLQVTLPSCFLDQLADLAGKQISGLLEEMRAHGQIGKSTAVIK